MPAALTLVHVEGSYRLSIKPDQSGRWNETPWSAWRLWPWRVSVNTRTTRTARSNRWTTPWNKAMFSGWTGLQISNVQRRSWRECGLCRTGV